ncbi:50S ribosomal protein L13 [Candidatus Dependentiae bacterium]|nr:50S ribosomal protein L13 [Candidatus Dependentiae bacterium]
MKTTLIEPEQIEKKWYLIDADGQTLGKLAVKIVEIIKGKNKPEFRQDKDCGDFVVITNASKIKVTGNKLEQKEYFKHSLWVGHFKMTKLKDMMKTKPEEVILHAVKGMLPKNHLGRKLLKKVRVFSGNAHNHESQQPLKIEL